MLLNKVRKTIARYAMLNRGDKVLVGVSGGVDSAVLLDILHRLSYEQALTLVIAHLDHGLREEAEEDARFVERLATEKGLELIHKRIDVRAIAAAEHRGLEEAGHWVRRRFLQETAQRIGAKKIAIGHTLNDRAETLLFHLIRGSGPTGLVGIRPTNGMIVRPLIETSREEILSYARELSLTWREDRTNQDIFFSRNRIRHQVIPLLEEVNPRFLESVKRAADLILAERFALDALVDPLWEEILVQQEGECLVLSRDRFASFSPAIQGVLLRRGLRHVRGDLQGIEQVHIDDLRRLIASPRAHGEIHLPGLICRVERARFSFDRGKEETAIPEIPIELGANPIPELGISLEISLASWNGDWDSLRDRGEDVEVADADLVRFPLYLCTRRNGDRFSPLGLGQEKKLNAFLLDAHIPFYERDRLPLLCDQERIIWVVGVRLSHAVRVTKETKRVLVMQREVIR